MTPTQDPIIAWHPQCDGLLVFGPGCYTSAKDVNYGNLVCDLMQGKCIPNKFAWSYNEVSSSSQQPRLVAKHDIRELNT